MASALFLLDICINKPFELKKKKKVTSVFSPVGGCHPPHWGGLCGPVPPPDLGMGAIALEFNLVVGLGRAGRGRLLPPPPAAGVPCGCRTSSWTSPTPKKKTPGCPWGQAPPLLPKEGTRCSQPVSRLQSIVEGKKKGKKKQKAPRFKNKSLGSPSAPSRAPPQAGCGPPRGWLRHWR